jgi:hypothetical protein
MTTRFGVFSETQGLGGAFVDAVSDPRDKGTNLKVPASRSGKVRAYNGRMPRA